MNYDWNFSILLNSSYQKILLDGFLRTVVLTFWCVALGTPIGVMLGSIPFINQTKSSFLTPTSNNRIWINVLSIFLNFVSYASIFIVDFIRSIPLLLLILTTYYGLPIFVGVVPFLERESDVSPFLCAVVALTINLSAFVADIVRGAASSVSKGDIFAAKSIGMKSPLIWRRVVLPQVFREILPSLSLLYITMFKMSTLASVVAVYEVLHSAGAVIQKTYRPLELYIAVCMLFVVSVMPFALIARQLEKSKLFARRS